MGRALEILIVGRGRVGSSLAQVWRRLGHEVRLVAHDGRAPLRQPALVVLAVPDRAVAATAEDWAPRLPPTLFIHTAGALGLDALDAAKRAGHRVGSLHPLQAIARKRASLTGAFAAVDASPKDRRLLSRLAREAGLIPLPTPPRDRRRYHLGAVLAANSQAPLLETAVAELVASGVPERAARQALAQLAHSAIQAWSRQGGPEGLTGPVARGDAATVARHLEVLQGQPSARALYVALARVALTLAARRRPVPQGLAAVARALR